VEEGLFRTPIPELVIFGRAVECLCVLGWRRGGETIRATSGSLGDDDAGLHLVLPLALDTSGGLRRLESESAPGPGAFLLIGGCLYKSE
jgi:hypothetical protein